jgi:hypothetical protein
MEQFCQGAYTRRASPFSAHTNSPSIAPTDLVKGATPYSDPFVIVVLDKIFFGTSEILMITSGLRIDSGPRLAEMDRADISK